jgi:inhibitor of KinA sporulation pathway (predicted exonuclease)
MREAIIFDTEYTAWEGSAARNWTAPGEFREILQIGALRANIDALAETSAFSVLVKPTLNPQLSDYIQSLTGIVQSRIDREGLALSDAVNQFVAFCGERRIFCYGSDGLIIAKNLALVGLRGTQPGLRSENIGHWFARQGVDVRNLNSGSLAAAVGIALEGRAHDALYDCRSILAAVKVLVTRGAANPFTV